MLLTRHASAGHRLESAAADRRRELDPIGRADASAIPQMLAAHVIDRIVTSPHVRCVQTVAPLALERGLTVEVREELARDASRDDVLTLLEDLPDTALVCTHREVFERIFRGEVTCEKGGTWLVERQPGRRVRAVAYLPPRPSVAPLLPA